MLEVNEVAETVSIETSLRMFWYDERLSLRNGALKEVYKKSQKEYITLHPSITSQLWIPDIFVDQAVSLRKPMIHTPPTSLRVYRDGMIRYSTR